MTDAAFLEKCREFGVDGGPEMLRRFDEFEERLYAANETGNLTRVPRGECRERHFLDSLALSPLLENGESVVDIGTGAGFPGVPLALARPGLTLTLLDAATKEIRFLESLVDIAPFGIIMERAEVAARSPEFRERYDVVTGRAFAPLSIQAEASAAFVRVGGRFMPMRSDGEEFAEFSGLGLQLEGAHSYEMAGARRAIPMYRKVSPTAARYPRTWAAMKRAAGNLSPDESR